MAYDKKRQIRLAKAQEYQELADLYHQAALDLAHKGKLNDAAIARSLATQHANLAQAYSGAIVPMEADLVEAA